MDAVAEPLACVREGRDSIIHGLRMVFEPRYLRFFGRDSSRRRTWHPGSP
jgi:hypothetical protein